MLWSLVLGNGLIALAYFSIPLTLLHFMRKQPDLKFNSIFVMFGLFIFGCGTTHLASILNIWVPAYRLDAVLLILTAGISVATAIVLWPLATQASDLLDDRTKAHQDLAIANAQLQKSMEQLAAHIRKAEDSEQQFRLTLESAPNGMAIVGLDGRWIVVNQALCQMLGYSEQELLTMDFQQITHPEDLETDLQHMHDLLDGNINSYRIEKRYYDHAGRIINIQLDVAILRDSLNKPVHFISQIIDITERKIREQQLHEATELAQVTLSSIGDGVIRTNAEGVITFCNPAAVKVLKHTPEQLVGKLFKNVICLYDGKSKQPIDDPVTRVLESGVSIRLDMFSGLSAFGGEIHPIADSVSPIRDLSGATIGAVFVFQDMSEARKLTDQLTHQARHDTLTGLPNRLAFEEALKSSIAEVQQHDSDHLLMYLDLDHFKIVNDSCGHATGDRLLIDVASRIRACLRTDDFLARVGGDEFAVLLRNATSTVAERMSANLIAAVESSHVVHEGRIFRAGLSIGIVDITLHNCALSQLMAQADTACYAAKDRGRGRYHVYETNDAEILQAERIMDWAQRIQNAFDNNLYRVFLQKIVNRDRQLIGYEALVRMQDETGKIIPPGSFMPAVKRMGWSGRIDQWMMNTVIKSADFQQFKQLTHENIYVSINLDAKSIGDASFSQWMLTLLDDSNIDREMLRFEITEMEQLQGTETEVHLIDELTRRGYRVWLDDFGTGYNSFDLLKRLKVHGIKIDTSFTRDLLSDPINRALVDAVVTIGKMQNLEIVAEGVETEEIYAALLEMGVNAFQGHLFHVAEPAHQVLARS